MKLFSSRLACAVGLVVTIAWSGVAGAANHVGVAAAAKACKAGTDPQEPGIEAPGGFLPAMVKTPTTVPGAVTVSPREAKCLMDKLGAQLVVVQAVADEHLLPGAIQLAWAGSPKTDPAVQKSMSEALAQLTQGDKDRPLLIYCHHVSCHLSYNASLRASQAGYRNVFWLRQGIEGWQHAGYPFKSEVVGKDGLPGDFADRVAACNQETAKFDVRAFSSLAADSVTDADLEAAFQSAAKQDQEQRAACLNQLASRMAPSPAVQKEMAARLSRNAHEVDEYYRSVRKAFEANPAQVLVPALKEYDVEPLKKTLAQARGFRTVAQKCGTYNPGLPDTNAEIREFNRRQREYWNCLEADDKVDIDRVTGNPDEDFADAVKTLQAVARYTCGRWKGANCVPESEWRRVADVASPANGELVGRVKKLRVQDAYESLQARENVKKWAERVEAHLKDASAREAEEAQSRRTYSAPTYVAPAYQPPPPPVYRVPSNTIYNGVK